jgi:DNA-binding transcriptional MerR regulator
MYATPDLVPPVAPGPACAPAHIDSETLHWYNPHMVADSDTFDLAELSGAAGVTPRTIRYYVQQGLLPSPGTRGPGTRYERAHLDRLQLIRRLQRQHLPLAEIRRRLEALDDDGIRDALALGPEHGGSSSALDYVRDVLARQSARTIAEPEARLAAARPRARSALGQSPPALAAPAAAGAPPPGGLHRVPSVPTAEATSTIQPSRATRSTWERIPIAPDVELHVRRPLSREQNRQVERLLEAARDLFAEEP